MGQGGWEGRIEVFVKIQKKKIGGGVGGLGRGGRLGGHGGCERRIEVFRKIHKKWGVGRWGQVGGRVGGGFGSGGRVGGVRVDVNEELKFLGKFTKKKLGGGGGRAGGQVGGGGSGWWGVRVFMNAMLGVRGDVGMGDVNQE